MTARSVLGSVLAGVARPVLGQGAGFSIDAFMAAQSDGVYFDTTQLDRYFQESTGPTLADDVGEAIGLGLDQRTWGGQTLAQVLAGQTELVSNGTFVSDISGWTDRSSGTGSQAWSAGKLRLTSVDGSNRGRSEQAVSGLVVGQTYAVSFDLSVAGLANFQIWSGANQTGSSALLLNSIASGSFVRYFVANATTQYVFLDGGATAQTADFDNISVKLVPGKHALQSSASLRPLRQTGYSVGNNPELVTNGTFDVDASGWTAFYGTSSIVSGKVRITNTNGTFNARISQPITCVIGKTYAISAERIAGTGTPILAVALSASVVGGAILNVNGQATNTLYFVATQTTHYVMLLVGFTATIGLYADFDNISVKEVASTYLQAKFDGSDDNLLTNYTAGSGANFIGCKTTVPASIASTQLIMGASGSSANRCFIGVDTSGYACGGVGSDSTATIVGTSDIRNTEADIFLTFDGSTVRLIVNGVVEYEAAQNSTATTTIPFRLGANNNNGTAGSFYGGAIREAWVGREYINAARAAQIASA